MRDCRGAEFPCPPGAVCVEGLCVDRKCQNVDCDAGKACRGGQCVAACDEVVCPHGQHCDPASGSCTDSCAGVECLGGQVCEQGVCVAPCTCRACPARRERDKSGGRWTRPPARAACAAPRPSGGAPRTPIEGGIIVGTGGVDASGGEPGAGRSPAGSGGSTEGSTPGASKEDRGCGCQLGGRSGADDALMLLILPVLLAGRRRRP